MVERSLSMREVPGSIPRFSNSFFFCVYINFETNKVYQTSSYDSSGRAITYSAKLNQFRQELHAMLIQKYLEWV